MSTNDRPALIIATDHDSFNVSPWEAEGFRVKYIPNATQTKFEDAAEDFESSEKFGIVGKRPHPIDALRFTV
jgi:hypothetical protein